MGGIEFSPKVQHQRDRITLWKNVLSKKRGGKLSTSLLTRLEKKVGISHTLSYSIPDIKLELSNAYSKYKELIKPSKGANLRDEWIETLAAAKAAANQTTLASELLQQRQREKQRQAFRAIKLSTRSEDTNVAITQVIETINGVPHLRTSKEEVEAAILAANNAKYRQTGDTPTMSTLLPDLGFLGNTTTCADILNGTYVPCTPIDPYTRALFKAFQKPPNIPTISLSYTPEEYINGWKKMNEKTSSGLSGIHFGHHKACAQNICLATFESTMCSIPYQSGYSPRRYQKSVNTMFKKKQNRIAADQLRTILLLEADFNHLNKKLGRDLMYQAERFNLIAPEQFGSRKSHSCIDQVIIKRLYYDALRFLRRSGFLCSNDAKACYDRIVHSIASLAMQRVGMPIEPILCMLQSLQNMTHHVRTAHGLSSSTYGCSLLDGKPVQGSGQGNGASPTIWTLISSPLLEMMRRLNFGVTFSSPLSNEDISFVGCSFVDDTDLLQTSPSLHESVRNFQHKMQQAIDAWSTGLRATGGALVPSKSWIYPIEFSFDAKGEPSYTPINQLGLQFTVHDAHQQRCPLEQINPHVAKDTLGVFLASDGNETAQIDYLRTKVASWVDKVRSNHLSKHHAKIALTSTIYKTLEYPISALNITPQQWKSIVTPLHKCGLQLNGVCSTLPTALREGAVAHMALDFKCMYKLQGIHKLEKYLHFREHDGLVGQMIRLNEELLKLELGLPGNIFDADYPLYHNLATDSWIKSLWKFLFDMNIQITMRSPPLKPTKTHDTYLIEAFAAQGFKNSQLRRLNNCRKHLQVTTLGDITVADGSIILPDIKRGQLPSSSCSTFTWPRQPSPDDQSWKLWRKALKQTFEYQGSVTRTLRSDSWEPLHTRRFNWFFNHHHGTLFHRLPTNQWQLYRMSNRRGRQPAIRIYHRTSTLLRSIPPQSTPSPVIHLSPHRVQLRRTGTLMPPPPPPLRTTFLAFAQSLYPNLSWAFTNLQGLDNFDHIAYALRQGNCAMISDGFFQPSKSQATGAWILGNEAQHRAIHGTAPSVGPKHSQSAYRGELAGLYGGLLTLKLICAYSNITTGRVLIGCDGLGALKRIQSPASLSTSHFDYVSSITRLIQDLPLTCHLTHVNGHLDKVLAMDQLSITEQMNVTADILAREANAHDLDFNRITNLPLYKEYGPITLSSTCTKITSSLRQNLYTAITRTNTRDYWRQKHNLPADASDSVAWTSLTRAFKSLSPPKQIETVKWNADFCGTGKNLQRWKEQTHSSCPVCGEENETTTHILQCHHPTANTQWNTSLASLKDWMIQQATSPDIINVILENLHAWRDNRPPVQYEGTQPHLREAQQRQTLLGWQSFLRGFLTPKWIDAQHCHYSHTKSLRTGERWISALIKKLWAVSWDMWRFRNGVLHSQSTSIPTNFTFLLMSTILTEFNHGCRLLPPSCHYLFPSTATSILRGTTNSKKLWLATVWSARDVYSPADTICQSRNAIVTAYVDAWKKKIKV